MDVKGFRKTWQQENAMPQHTDTRNPLAGRSVISECELVLLDPICPPIDRPLPSQEEDQERWDGLS